MKLTIEENRERIKRYSHIKPASRWGSVLCSAYCPGTSRSCTLKRGHAGPHVAHGAFRRVVAVWDKGIRPNPLRGVAKRGGAPQRKGTGAGTGGRGFITALDALRRRFLQREHSIEEVVFLVLAVGMAGFAIDWALRIMGLK